jgi:two-component sensor histidine kinase
MLADLSFADLLLFVPSLVEGDEGYVVAGHVRPSTSRSAYRTEVVGARVEPGERPLVDLAMRTGEMVDGGLINQAVAPRLRVLAIPVRHRDDIIAVVSREYSPDTQREPGELELNYFQTFRRFARMIAEGTFPYPVDESEIDEAPRVGDGLMIVDATARVRFSSPNATSALIRMGTTGELEGRRLADSGIHPRAVRTAFSTHLPHTDEIEQGSHSVMVRSLPILAAGEVTGAVVLMRDVTDLRRRDRLLVSKDATIAEIHHRVKNNLQTISSLLRLQGRRLQLPEARLAIEESVRRIRTIAIVHEILSQELSDDVDFGDIVRPLVRLVEEGLTSVDRPLRFEVQGEAGLLPSAVATSLAVVLTELLQNAADHAFPDGDGTVEIRFRNDAHVLSVLVVDDGVGLPAGFRIDDATGLGLTIVRTLIETDLGGRIDLRPGEGAGTVVELTVPLVRGWLPDLG